ncbi:hypothetical protein SLA2020_317490 [Shorea laevis]
MSVFPITDKCPAVSSIGVFRVSGKRPTPAFGVIGVRSESEIWVVNHFIVVVEITRATGCGSAVGVAALVHNVAISCQKIDFSKPIFCSVSPYLSIHISHFLDQIKHPIPNFWRN